MAINAIIEFRPWLRCVNVFLKCEHMVNEKSSIKITVGSNNLSLNGFESATEIDLINYEVDPFSLSNFIVLGRYISFRLSLVKSLQWEKEKFSAMENKLTYSKNIKVNVKPEQIYQIICNVCKNSIRNQIKLERLLELPSGVVEISDFFCHNGPNLEQSLVPKENDIFYGVDYFIIKNDNLFNLKVKEEMIYCKYCLNFLGELTFNKKAVKFWNENILCKTQEQKTFVLIQYDLKKIMCDIIKNVLHESQTDPSSSLCHFSNALIESKFPNSKKQYLLLKVLDTKLNCVKLDKSNSESKQKQCLQILFKLEKDYHQPLLKFWMKDLNVHKINISHTIYNYITTYLIKYSKVLPEVHRESNGFLLSYIFY